MYRDGIIRSVVSEEEREGEQGIGTRDQYTGTAEINAFQTGFGCAISLHVTAAL